nr:sulfur carrier protein ThiS [Nocardioides ginsengisegetis]
MRRRPPRARAAPRPARPLRPDPRSTRVNIIRNGQPAVVANGSTVADLVRGRRGIAVAVNGEVVPRDRHTVTLLRDGDVVEVVTAVQGG